MPESWWGTVGPGLDYLYTLEQAGEGTWVPSLIDSRTDAVLARGRAVEGFAEARERAIEISRDYLERADPRSAPRPSASAWPRSALRESPQPPSLALNAPRARRGQPSDEH